MAVIDDKLDFCGYAEGMTAKNAEQVLDPLGETLQGIVRGRRGAGRVAVTVLWPQIEKAMDAGVSITAIWEALNKNGLVSIQRRAFSDAVQARREGARGAGEAAKPASEANAPAVASVSEALGEAAPAQAGAPAATAAKPKPAKPHRPWRTGPYQPPDPTAVFKPRDPLADDD